MISTIYPEIKRAHLTTGFTDIARVFTIKTGTVRSVLNLQSKAVYYPLYLVLYLPNLLMRIRIHRQIIAALEILYRPLQASL